MSENEPDTTAGVPPEDNNTRYLLAADGEYWAVEPMRMRAILRARITGTLPAAEIESRTTPVPKHKRTVAVLPLRGLITHRSNLISAFLGGTALDKWAEKFDELVAEPRVDAILLDVDSPGGSVDYVAETTDKVYNARGTKPIVAIANTWAASAAYSIASAAERLYVTPSGAAGSIGVWTLHLDESERMKREGFDVTLVKAGKHKIESNPWEPLSEEAHARMQQEIDYYYDLFTSAVARNRGATQRAVKAGYGEGRMLQAKEAVAANLVDGIATYDQVLQRMGGQIVRDREAMAATAKREAELLEVEARMERTYTGVVVPPNPSNGGGEGVEGPWSKPTLKDFTDESWEDLSGKQRQAIGKHYGHYRDLASFTGLRLPHHFPSNHSNASKASLNGVRNALARLPQTGGIPEADRSRIEGHLRAHLPSD